MKRKLYLIMLIACLLGLCACGKTDEKAVSESVAEEATAETIKEIPTEAAESAAETPETDTEPETEAEKLPGEAPASLLHLYQTTINRGMDVGNNYEGNAYVRYPAFALYENDAQQYPKLAKALDSLNSLYETEYSDHLVYSHDLGEEALADGTDMEIRFYDYLTLELRRADSHIVSILESYESYTGGVHGYYAFYGNNLDPQSGREILLSEVIANQDAFRETVKEKLYSQYANIEFDNLDTALEDMYSTENGAMPWTMDYSGVTLYFNPYHIAAYASGMQIITVPFNENPGLFVQGYLDVPDSYVQQMGGNVPTILDVNGDGMNEVIFVTAENTEEDTSEDGYSSGYQDWTINCGGDSVTLSDYCYSADFYLVRANGQYYVYVFEVSDNDYSVLSVVDLKTMTNDTSRNFNAFLTGYGSNYEYTDDGFKSVMSVHMFTDPLNIPLSSRVEVLGSNSGAKIYEAGSDGWPVSDDPYYNVASAMVYTAKIDADCKEVDENGAEKSDAKLSAGKYYVLVRTDGKTWADIQELKEGEYTEDPDYPYVYIDEATWLRPGRPIYRLPYKDGQWPHTINGIDEAEIFDGIIYAG